MPSRNRFVPSAALARRRARLPLRCRHPGNPRSPRVRALQGSRKAARRCAVLLPARYQPQQASSLARPPALSRQSSATVHRDDAPTAHRLLERRHRQGSRDVAQRRVGHRAQLHRAALAVPHPPAHRETIAQRGGRPLRRRRSTRRYPRPARWRWRLDPSGRWPPARPCRSSQRRIESGKIRIPMLVEITKVPNAENSAIHLHPTDNVAIARVPLPAGAELRVDGLPVLTRDAIPAGHKLALWDIAAGETVERYGQVIGRATVPIDAGRHVHTHNLAFEELVLDYEFPTTEIPIPGPRADAPTFLGYAREDGRAGTRNYIAVVAASNCAAHTAELIARSYDGVELPPNVDGVVAFPHGEGCGHALGPDVDQLRRTLGGVLMHPNVSAALILGLGCEVNQIDHYMGGHGGGSDRLVGMTLQTSGGTTGTLAAGRREIGRFLEQAAAEQRVPCS